MALNIKDPETDRLARELAELTGESITVALREAILERLGRERRRGRPAVDFTWVITQGRELPDRDIRSAEEILGYDEHGLPR